jgi:2-dehydropantoate 2-reductase
MKVCIVGAGAIGSTLGAGRANAGHDVSLIARGMHLDAIVRNGLRMVDHLDGTDTVLPLPASDDPVRFGRQDLVIVAVKAHALAAVLARIGPLLGSDTVVIPAINGLPWWYFQGVPHHAARPFIERRVPVLDPAGTLFKDLPAHHILGCVVHVAAEIRAPGEVHRTGGRLLMLGEPAASASARLDNTVASLRQAGFDAIAEADIRRAVWIKLVGNLSFNPVAALTGMLQDELWADAGAYGVIRQVLLEGMAVASALGVELGITPEERIDMARRVGNARISMLQDLEQGRPLEIDAVVTAVLQVATWVGVDMPGARMLEALIRARAGMPRTQDL